MKHSGYLTTSGAEIYYEQYGSGTPLLILHGNSQSLAVFYPFLRTFLPDFQVILMDSRGHGRSRLSVHTALHGFSTEDMADDVIALLNHLHLSLRPPAGIQRWCQYRAGDRMQIPGAAENAHLYQRQRLTGRAAHAAAPCRPNAAQHFKSPGESPAACFKMQLLFCLCILRVLCGLCTVHPESFPAISEEFLCFRHIRSLCRQRKAMPFRINFPPDSGRTKKEA